MLPAPHRLRRSSEFALTVRRGARARRGRVVVHSLVGAGAGPATVGFVVSRSVGASVVRHRVIRQLRAVLRAHLTQLPAGSSTVVRALPEAAHARYADLDRDVSAALHALGRESR